MFKLYLEKAEEPEIKFPTSFGSLKKQESSRKTSTSASLTTLKPLYRSQQIGKCLKRWEYQTTLPASWETRIQVKNQQFESLLSKIESTNLERIIVTLFI